MGLSPKLILRQSQTLAITPQLMQAIKLLQLSSVELVQFVERELVQNPLLERDEAGDGLAGDGPAAEGEAAASPETAAADWASDQLETSAQAIADKLDTAPENIVPDDSYVPGGPGAGSGGGLDERPDFEAFLSKPPSLHDHLASQLAVAVTDPTRRLIGAMLIDAIDENGYLQAQTAEVAARLGAPPCEVEAVLGIIHGFDPSGVGARTLAECLGLQLAERDRLDPAMQALLANLPLLAKRDMAALRRACGVDAEDMADMLAELRTLDPKPGRRFWSAPVEVVVPDIFVREAPGGTWSVELNPATMPRLLVNRSYHATIDRRTLSVEDRSYLSEQLQSASWLIKSLDQRARTMIRVGQEIVRQQDGFFAHGVEHLRPMTLRHIADAIEMHESTVSRVTSNKYIATPRGTFEMKYFFTAAIAASDGGEAHAAEAVRQKIRRLIDAEDPAQVLSDDQLVKALKDDGIDIARRTVAKYREAMRIGSSVQRRREKQGLVPA